MHQGGLHLTSVNYTVPIASNLPEEGLKGSCLCPHSLLQKWAGTSEHKLVPMKKATLVWYVELEGAVAKWNEKLGSVRHLAAAHPVNGATSPTVPHAKCWGIKHVLLLMLHQIKALWCMPGAMGWGIITVFFPYSIDEMSFEALPSWLLEHTLSWMWHQC